MATKEEYTKWANPFSTKLFAGDKFDKRLARLALAGRLPKPLDELDSVYQRRGPLDGAQFNHETQSLVKISEVWNHSILLGGLSANFAEAFALSLHQLFREGKPLNSGSPHADVDFVLNRLARALLPGREFFSPRAGVHELRFIPSDADKSSVLFQDVAKLAMETNVPLEFGYPARRIIQHDAMNRFEFVDTSEVHVRRVNVKSMDSVGFSASHSRGHRRFNFSEVRWAIAKGVVAHKVKPEAGIRLDFIDGGLITHFGKRGDNGQLLLGPDEEYRQRQKPRG